MYQFYYFRLWKFLGAVGLLLILWASVTSGVGPKIEIPHIDKILHFSVYLIACYYFCQVLQNKKIKKIIFLIFLYSALMELLQSFTDDRISEGFDLLANFMGAFTGALISCFTPNILISIDKLIKKIIA